MGAMKPPTSKPRPSKHEAMPSQERYSDRGQSDPSYQATVRIGKRLTAAISGGGDQVAEAASIPIVDEVRTIWFANWMNTDFAPWQNGLADDH